MLHSHAPVYCRSGAKKVLISRGGAKKVYVSLAIRRQATRRLSQTAIRNGFSFAGPVVIVNCRYRPVGGTCSFGRVCASRRALIFSKSGEGGHDDCLDAPP